MNVISFKLIFEICITIMQYNMAIYILLGPISQHWNFNSADPLSFLNSHLQ